MASPSATPLAGRLCDAGLHTMDPTWEICPYCDAERRSKEKTQVPQPAPLRAVADDRKTRVGDISAGVPRETKTMPPGSPYGSGPPHGGAGDTRRIMGVLITYTWRPEGELFPIREGKNFIGAGNVSSEVTHRPCDIQIRTDPMLSSEHALILCRAGEDRYHYDLVDQKSSNGTFLNGKMVPIQGIGLGDNYAEIKTGNTIWTFIKIAAPPSAAPPQVLVKEEVPPPEESKPSKAWTDVK